jgi:hypothetical protein
VKDDNVNSISTYMRAYAPLLGERILQEYPALQQFDDPVSPRLERHLKPEATVQDIVWELSHVMITASLQ